MATDQYQKKYREAIKKSKTDKEINTVIDKIYGDGYCDGFEDSKND